MLVEKTIGTIADYPGLEVEYVLLDWHESHRRIIKKRLASGEDIGIRLSEADAAKGLNQGDVLGVIDEKTVIVVRIAPVEALMIQVASASMIPKLAFEMGNKHAPFFKGDQPTEFFSPLDLPLKALLESIPGVAVKEGRVVLNKERAISSSTGGGHSHDHGNDHAHHDHGNDHAHHGHGHDHADHGQDHADHGNDHDSHVLVVDAGSEAMIPKVAFEVGNSHAPFYFGDQPTEFLTPNSAQVRAMLQRLHGVTVRVGHTQPDPDKAISATGGGHGTPEEDGGYDGKGGTRLEGSFYEDSHQQSEHCHCHDPNADHQH